MKVCIYSRVSTNKQDAENQPTALTEWARQRGFDIVSVYTAEESAWKSGHQRVLARFLEDARKRKFEVVLV